MLPKYRARAKLEFYIENGTDERVKQEFRLALADKNATLTDFEKLAVQYMPDVTTVLNIEFMTKRKFYYYSDEFIDGVLRAAPGRGDVPEPLIRLFKIIDNRKVFLDYLTSKTVCFKRAGGKYCAWWERLRNTKLGGLDIDAKLVREYSHKLDEELARKKFVKTVVANAVYSGNVETDFLEDIADLLSNINDNDAQRLRVAVYGKNGRKLKQLYGSALEAYDREKRAKYQKLKNRLNDKAIS